jgi:ribosomal protein S18 acetylase RimI-like enzyme
MRGRQLGRLVGWLAVRTDAGFVAALRPRHGNTGCGCTAPGGVACLVADRCPLVSRSMISLAPWDVRDDLYDVYATNEDYWRYSGDLDPDNLDQLAVTAALADLAEEEEALVARDGKGRIVGYVRVLSRHSKDGHPWIGLLLVHGSYRRQGYGRAIVSAVEQRLRGTGADAVRLGVLANNLAAQRFWARLGYLQIDLRPDLAKGRATMVLEHLL